MADRKRISMGMWPLRTLSQRVVRWGLRCGWRLLTRLEIEGLEAVPASGSFLVVINHLTILDAVLLFCYVPRTSAHLVHEDWKSWFTRYILNGIFIADNSDAARSTNRARSLLAVLTLLRRDTGVVIAPEGRLSRTGSLERGRPGVAHLALLGKVPVVPIAIFGQEKVFGFLRRLRRARVRIRVGSPIDPPTGVPNDKRMREFTDSVMVGVARMLPSKYRGVYATSVSKEGTVAD